MDGLFVGLATVDLGYLVADYPSEDTKSTALDQVTAAGGPATNAAVAFAFLSGQARLVTVLGQHWITGLVRDDLTRHHVEVADLTPAEQAAPPTSSIIVSQSNASRTIVSLDATRTQAPAPTDPGALLGTAGIVLVDGHLVEPCSAIARAARATGTPVVFDGGRWKDTHAELLRHVDVAICSSRFAPPGAADAHDFLLDLGVRFVATTNGEGPIRWSTPNDQGVIKPPSVVAVDTLGAGDIFHGAFCHYFAAGRDFLGALENAATVAAASCEQFGTRAWMVTGRERFPG
ncbi:kinase [Longispora fulva]|uniref:Sugar/nucleoside kinase (Ribokinase family) n=1 Tax=Longispora fulva TaxID=619741 RepID=A0A8J7G802_9ACTN|nr:PfkB family carbohydrate kinase [Longispora fulva]MBG6134620.1 sugar/nucleoside kinase (ribokinase family) [Longispora fulva]GIG61827.1 kinase [Longispora fulva]